ncbi:hypothetical protein [Paenibacillus sp. IHBB 10380]|uniref:hypothetical protein n=1 Tax=Paenibacillus sp. IHBB 10380 TaxID=1566358 RepID=UPI0005CFBDEE|nr:hypothetical protein [Paenibacillus sp. IHBB 10380]AJS58049.1 hypothetical protein UB51_05540 [Paenibacillus sp. IHBB 10380]
MNYCLSNNPSLIFNYLIYLDMTYIEEKHNVSKVLHKDFLHLSQQYWERLILGFVPNSNDCTNKDFVEWDLTHIKDRNINIRSLFVNEDFYENSWNDFFDIWYTEPNSLQYKLDTLTGESIPVIGDLLMAKCEIEGLKLDRNLAIQVLFDEKPFFNENIQNKNFIFATLEEFQSQAYDLIIDRIINVLRK